MQYQKTTISVALFSLSAGSAQAATSVINNNFRIFEDTLWLACFTLMIFSGLLLRTVSGGLTSKGYLFLAIAAISGAMWKGIGLIKRLFELSEPRWFYTLTRETFEGLTGIILAIAFLMIVYSVLQLIKKQKQLRRKKRR